MLVLNVVVTGDDVIVCSAGGSHNSRNLSHPPGGDASSDEGGRKRRDWTNHEFVSWLANLSEEGSQSLDAVLSLSSELKLLFRLKEKSVVSEPVED